MRALLNFHQCKETLFYPNTYGFGSHRLRHSGFLGFDWGLPFIKV